MDERRNLPQLRVRRAKERDIPELVSLENECFRDYYREHRFTESQFAEYLRKEGWTILVAVSLSSIVGYTAGSLRTSRSRSAARIDSIAVSQQSRERGVGSRLLRHFVREAKRRCCKSVSLEVAAPNEGGIRFFSNRGFRKTRSLPEHYGEGYDGIRMTLDIKRKG